MIKSWKLTILVAIVCLIYSSCKEVRKRINNSFNSAIYSKKDYTEFKLDSVSLVTFLQTAAIADSIKEEVTAFYQRREYQYAWFSENRLSPSAINFYNQLKNYSIDFADSSIINNDMEQLFSEAEANEAKFLSKHDHVLKLEMLLTSSFFDYAHKAYNGVVKNPLDLEWYIPRKKKNYQLLLDTIVASDSNYFVNEPVNRYYISLKERLRQYRAIEKNGGWPTVMLSKKEVVKGQTDSSLAKVKLFFSITGDLKVKDSSNVFTDSLETAVRRFQRRTGLQESGKLDAVTIDEINIPVGIRIKQMMINMERLRWVPDKVEPDFILINIPEFMLHVFEKGKLAWHSNVVVGKTASQTIIFRGNISKIVVNPDWVVPTSILINELLPKIKEDPSYLANNDMEVLSGSKVIDPATINWQSYTDHFPYTLRQKPGAKNALGKIKFLFPNTYSIYLHDTPAKNLFDVTKRTFSHGCIRVETAQKLGHYLLRSNPSWPEDKFNEAFKADEQIEIAVKPPVPVYIVYFTTWVDSYGQLNFRKDVYGLDKILEKEIFE